MQRSLLLFLFLLCAGSVGASDSANRFGFAGREIFPVNDGIAHLKAVDLNNDDRTDLVVVQPSEIRPPSWGQ